MTLQNLPILEQIDDVRPVNFDRVTELLERNRLNWLVDTEPLILPDGKQTAYMGVVRQDTRHTFQAVSKGYVPMQNSELMEIAVMISELTGSEIEVSKAIGKGEVTYISIEGRTLEVSGAKVNDVIGEKIQLVNSHDGSRAFGIGFGHVVLSCTNGMTRFDRKGFVSVRHTTNMKDKLNRVIGGWKKILKESDRMLETYPRLMDRKVGQAEIQKVIEIVTGTDPNTPIDQVSTRKQNIIKDVWGSLTTEMSYKGQTAWGLMNGVTHYTSQKASTDSGLKSKMFGGNAKRDLSVWQYLNSL